MSHHHHRHKPSAAEAFIVLALVVFGLLLLLGCMLDGCAPEAPPGFKSSVVPARPEPASPQ